MDTSERPQIHIPAECWPTFCASTIIGVKWCKRAAEEFLEAFGDDAELTMDEIVQWLRVRTSPEEARAYGFNLKAGSRWGAYMASEALYVRRARSRRSPKRTWVGPGHEDYPFRGLVVSVRRGADEWEDIGIMEYLRAGNKLTPGALYRGVPERFMTPAARELRRRRRMALGAEAMPMWSTACIELRKALSAGFNGLSPAELRFMAVTTGVPAKRLAPVVRALCSDRVNAGRPYKMAMIELVVTTLPVIVALRRHADVGRLDGPLLLRTIASLVGYKGPCGQAKGMTDRDALVTAVATMLREDVPIREDVPRPDPAVPPPVPPAPPEPPPPPPPTPPAPSPPSAGPEPSSREGDADAPPPADDAVAPG